MSKSIKKEFPWGVEWRDEHGFLHREDGPAYEHVDGAKTWCLHGAWHRTDGPAKILINKDRMWFVYDNYIEIY